MLLFHLNWLFLRLTLDESGLGLNFLSWCILHSSLSLIYVLMNFWGNGLGVLVQIRLINNKRSLHVILTHAFFFFLKRTSFWHSWLNCYRLLNVRWKIKNWRIQAWSWAKATIVFWEVKIWRIKNVRIMGIWFTSWVEIWNRLRRLRNWWLVVSRTLTPIIKHLSHVICSSLGTRLCKEFSRPYFILVNELTVLHQTLR